VRRPRQRDDPVGYRLRYSLLTQVLHARAEYEYEAISHDREPGRPPEEATAAIEAARRRVGARSERAEEGPIEEALRLVEAASGQLRRLGWKWVGNPPRWYVRWLRRRNSDEDRHLGQFLDRTLEPASVVVYWSCVVEYGDWSVLAFLFEEPPPPRGIRRLLSPFAWRHPEQARRWLSRNRFVGRWGVDRDAWLRQYLRALREPRPRLTDGGRRLHAGLGLARVRQMDAPSYRVRYNLACLFCRLARRARRPDTLDEFPEAILAEAATQLSICLTSVSGRQRAAILDWAGRDPALAPLRSGWSEEWGQPPWPSNL